MFVINQYTIPLNIPTYLMLVTYQYSMLVSILSSHIIVQLKHEHSKMALAVHVNTILGLQTDNGN